MKITRSITDKDGKGENVFERFSREFEQSTLMNDPELILNYVQQKIEYIERKLQDLSEHVPSGEENENNVYFFTITKTRELLEKWFFLFSKRNIYKQIDSHMEKDLDTIIEYVDIKNIDNKSISSISRDFKTMFLIESHDIKNLSRMISKENRLSTQRKEGVKQSNIFESIPVFEELRSRPIVFSNTEKEIQFIPIAIYLDTESSVEIHKVYEAILNFLNSIDFEKSSESKEVRGSWFKELVAKSKSALTSKEVTDRLRKVEYGIEVNTILKTQSKVDKNQSEAFANILKSIENIPNAAIRIGSLIVVKVTAKSGDSSIQARTLSTKEIEILNRRPELSSKPSQLLLALSKAVAETNIDPLA